MEANGVMNLEMGSARRGLSKELEEEVFTSSDYTTDETNFGTIALEGLYTRWEHKHNVPEMRQSSELSAETHISEGSDSSSRERRKKDSGLRSKRGGKALKIHLFSQQDEAERRRSRYVAAIAENAPLYPLDLQDHGLDTSQDDESDRSSSFSPEVAANGFGSPIEILSRDIFDTPTSKPEENGVPDNDQSESAASLNEIPLSSKFEKATAENLESDYDGALREGNVRGRGLPGKYLTFYIAKTVILILLWFTLSTALTIYNKTILGNDIKKQEKSFPAPYLMNTVHFSIQGLISMILVRCIPSMRPLVQMSWKDYGMRAVPTALATALDIGFSNESLRFISVSFMTMCKSSAPIFLLIFAFMFKLEVPSYKLLGIIVIISTGVMMTVPEGSGFNLIGFVLVMSAAVMSGFRWTVTQLLLQKEEFGLSNPFAAMTVLTPIMAALSLVLSLTLEPWRKLGESNYFDSPVDILISFAIMLLGGSLAFFMVSTEYILLSETSAVTLTVAGIVKELVTVLILPMSLGVPKIGVGIPLLLSFDMEILPTTVAVIFLEDQFTLLKGFGLAVIMVGVSLYNLFKYQKLRERRHSDDSSNNLHGKFNYVPLEDTRAVHELGVDLVRDIP